MQLYLFGGAEINLPSRSVPILKNLIRETLIEINPESILQVPFARLHPAAEDMGEWNEGWFEEMMIDSGIEVFNAGIQSDIRLAKNPAIFINGGHDRRELIDSINANPELLDKILKAKSLVGESSGSMVVGEFMRASSEDSEMIKALGILKNTIIEPHYTERNYQKFMKTDLKESGMKYGIGIDSATGFIVDSEEFPNNWEQIGEGKIYIRNA